MHYCNRTVCSYVLCCSEIGRMNGDMIARDGAGARNVSTFLTELGARLPHETMGCISLLLVHLDGEVRQSSIRVGITLFTDLMWLR